MSTWIEIAKRFHVSVATTFLVLFGCPRLSRGELLDKKGIVQSHNPAIRKSTGPMRASNGGGHRTGFTRGQ